MELNQFHGKQRKLPSKKLEVDLTQEMSSQLQSGFVFQVVLAWFRVTSLVQWKFLANNELGCNFVIAYFCQKGVELRLYSCVIG